MEVFLFSYYDFQNQCRLLKIAGKIKIAEVTFGKEFFFKVNINIILTNYVVFKDNVQRCGSVFFCFLLFRFQKSIQIINPRTKRTVNRGSEFLKRKFFYGFILGLFCLFFILFFKPTFFWEKEHRYGLVFIVFFVCCISKADAEF